MPTDINFYSGCYVRCIYKRQNYLYNYFCLLVYVVVLYILVRFLWEFINIYVFGGSGVWWIELGSRRCRSSRAFLV